MNKPTSKNPEELLEYIEYQEAIIEALKQYASHNGSCSGWDIDKMECDCGLEDLLR